MFLSWDKHLIDSYCRFFQSDLSVTFYLSVQLFPRYRKSDQCSVMNPIRYDFMPFKRFVGSVLITLIRHRQRQSDNKLYCKVINTLSYITTVCGFPGLPVIWLYFSLSIYCRTRNYYSQEIQ